MCYIVFLGLYWVVFRGLCSGFIVLWDLHWVVFRGPYWGSVASFRSIYWVMSRGQIFRGLDEVRRLYRRSHKDSVGQFQGLVLRCAEKPGLRPSDVEAGGKDEE